MKLKTWALLVGVGICGMGLAQAQELRITLVGVAHEKGNVRVGLYASPKTFRKEAKSFATKQAPATAGDVTLTLRDVPPGRYAIMAYHDENANGELDRRFGMFPAEGYGLSNNPKVMGPPAFEDSAFDVSADEVTTISIDMRY
ncbi:DUF2141 domain-containing protein [Stutzerimonas stutzeri]|uniref:DUF2141 domain-containing protein n=1 Tax=Stutzerimonas sp. S1 TaxID=3030652 RepID=UPI0022258231|nr:DUF2141 domain-containing protein [Stutzerimonas sp. S1]MCW3150363.1 DUF2141 domain-containing protein [Stutzerimonas sp. S1]